MGSLWTRWVLYTIHYIPSQEPYVYLETPISSFLVLTCLLIGDYIYNTTQKGTLGSELLCLPAGCCEVKSF